MHLELLSSLQALLHAALEGRPVFVVSGRLAGRPWRVTYHAGFGVENTVVARALLEGDDAVIASVRRAKPADVSAAHLSWRDDPHFSLLHREFPAGAPWKAQATLLATFPLVHALRDAADVRSALDAFARHDGQEWRFRGARVLPSSTGLLVYAPNDSALRALLRPLLLQVPDAQPTPAPSPSWKAPNEEHPPPRRRRAPPRE
ncbi:hypothetical protein [Deinococcus yavapaiensis]|uniref:Uncharacterized protein n=1 Tax=Deinococcus yavapaiensis KR-236 TaxID=694435 RepID=A0A318S3Z3_9DEIO|nr:hypothetical protein [Deinococcus yavapaiensis]PYE53129.1 hypothetical protein DES52_110113 [Deinococcus yavapaiensis KR-236]